MVWTELRAGLEEALRSASAWDDGSRAALELAIPRDPAHGDWTCNVAMAAAKRLGRPPRALAEAIAAGFPRGGIIDRVEVAGPGFLNFRYSDAFVASLPGRILAEGERFGESGAGGGERVLVEYVSANPTGPMNVVSARAAAVGSALVRVMRAAGFEAEGEFYVNDAGNQVDLLGASVAARFAELAGVAREFPEDGYHGAYLAGLARELPREEALAALSAPAGDAWFRDQALTRMLAWQQRDLEAYGVTFARWFRESELHASGAVEEARLRIEQRGHAYRAEKPEGVTEAAEARVREEEGAAGGSGEATWLRASRHGDDMDRVLVRSDGRPTYLLPDIAYHQDKRARGFRRAIDLWGPDHHAYVRTLRAGLLALGLEEDFLEVLIVQQVNLLRDGREVKMSKRAGEFVTLRELVDEVGPDCAKFFFLMRSTSAHLDFDLTLALQQNDQNPAYYVQYAHARIASVLRVAAERGLTPATSGSSALTAPEEAALVRKLATFPEVVRGAAFAREPHRLPLFLTETAAGFHRFYHACRVVGEDAEVSRHRLRICAATQQVLRNGLALMGVSAPERLERAAEASA